MRKVKFIFYPFVEFAARIVFTISWVTVLLPFLSVLIISYILVVPPYVVWRWARDKGR